MSALNDMKIAGILADLNKLDTTIRGTSQNVKFLSRVKQNFDARLLLEHTNNLRRESMHLETYLRSLLGQVETLCRSTPHGSPMQAHLANIKGIQRRLPQQMTQLQADLQQIGSSANDRLNEPGRWGDAAAGGPVKDVMDGLAMIIQIIARVLRN